MGFDDHSRGGGLQGDERWRVARLEAFDHDEGIAQGHGVADEGFYLDCTARYAGREYRARRRRLLQLADGENGGVEGAEVDLD